MIPIDGMYPSRDILEEIETEVIRASNLHPNYPKYPHYGYAVILEELNELWDEVKTKEQNKAKMRKEATEGAATAIRFIIELT